MGYRARLLSVAACLQQVHPCPAGRQLDPELARSAGRRGRLGGASGDTRAVGEEEADGDGVGGEDHDAEGEVPPLSTGSRICKRLREFEFKL